MSPRTRRVTVRAYNLRPGDVVAATGRTVEAVVTYPAAFSIDAFTDVSYIGVRLVDTVDTDTLVTVTRTYA